MNKKIFVYGAGGLGREVLSMLKVLEEWEPAGFIDDGIAKNSLVTGGLKVIGGRDILSTLEDNSYVVITVGDPLLKNKIFKEIDNGRIIFPTIIHPSAILQDRDSIHIGQGSIITAGCILTIDVSIGQHVLINLNSTIGHNVRIGDFSSIMPGVNIAGEVTIGENVLVGSGASILNRVQIHAQSKVGMGAVVINNVAHGSTVVGVPAKPIVN